MRTRAHWSHWKRSCLGLVALGVILSTPTGPVHARALAPRAPSGGDSVRIATPLHDLSVSKANKILLPLYSKWVEILLRNGASRVGTLIDIRVGYLVLLLSAKNKIRIKRRLIVRVTRSRKKAGSGVGVARGQTKNQRLKKNTATLKAVIGKTVRLKLDDGRLVDGTVQSVGTAHVTLDTSTGSVEVPLGDVNIVLMSRRRQTRRTRRTAVDREKHTATSSLRANATAMVPRGHRTRQPISASFHRSLLLKYQKIQASGARLRSWGLGLWIGGMVLNTIGGVLLATASSERGSKAGLALSIVGGVIDVPGVIMAIWGHCRYNRGMDMVTEIYLHQ